MVYPYNRIVFSNKTEWITDTCYNKDETWKHYAGGGARSGGVEDLNFFWS